ncbi:hypothetical protein HDU96_003797 [Phlyctochytrium bullatum]|nr:hypothetical protein HDU96_003797 [Phlyctochytrium bullatum]
MTKEKDCFKPAPKPPPPASQRKQQQSLSDQRDPSKSSTGSNGQAPTTATTSSTQFLPSVVPNSNGEGSLAGVAGQAPMAASALSTVKSASIPSGQAPMAASALSTVTSAPRPSGGKQNVNGTLSDDDREDSLPPPKRRCRTNERFVLHYAAASNDAAKVTELLSKDHHPYESDDDGRLPMELSTSKAVWSALSVRMDKESGD